MSREKRIDWFGFFLLLLTTLTLLSNLNQNAKDWDTNKSVLLAVDGGFSIEFNEFTHSLPQVVRTHCPNVLCFDLVNAQQPTFSPTKIKRLKLFDTEFEVNTYEIVKRRKSPVTFVALHYNEQTGLNLVKEIIQKRGGRLIELVSKESDIPQRYIFFDFKGKTLCVDPNRIYSKVGIEKDLKNEDKPCSAPVNDEIKDVVYEVNKFAEKLLDQFLPKKRCVKSHVPERRLCRKEILVAVHNNTPFDRLDPNFNIKSYEQDAEEGTVAEAVYMVNKEDVDNFFLVSNRKLFNMLLGINKTERQFNITIQKQPPIPDDGSLSVLCGNKRIDYINIEADIDNGANRQRVMINTVLDLFLSR